MIKVMYKKHYPGGPNQCNKARKRNEWNKHCKEEGINIADALRTQKIQRSLWKIKVNVTKFLGTQ